MYCLECGNDTEELICKHPDCPYPTDGEFVSGRLDGVKLHRCSVFECVCGGCEVE
jgi:hypothetical protein